MMNIQSPSGSYVSLSSLQPPVVRVKVQTWKSNPIALWIIIAILVIGLACVSYLWITGPDVSKIQDEANLWKAKYEVIMREYDQSKRVYEAGIASIEAKYKKLNSDYQISRVTYKNDIGAIQAKYDLLKRASDASKTNVQKPKTSKERVDRLKKLGYELTIINNIKDSNAK
jgi:hypothetical protein